VQSAALYSYVGLQNLAWYVRYWRYL